MVWNYQNADCSLKIILLFIIIFGTLSVPYLYSKRCRNRVLTNSHVKVDSEYIVFANLHAVFLYKKMKPEILPTVQFWLSLAADRYKVDVCRL